jgi:selenocysteine lyase/cysteine desulfurase
MEEVRAKAAEFLGAGLEELVLTENTTSGMNAVAQGLAGSLRTGDEILTTNHEHPGGSICWEYLAKHQGVRIVRIPMPAPVKDKGQIVQLIQEHITPRTRVCSFSHVETITGLQMPLADMASLTRPREIVLVCDGAQAPGMLKIDVKALQVDAYASSSHKWMLAPKGSGLLYIRKEAQQRIQPMLLSTGYNAYTAASGTRNVPQILGHGLTIDFHNAIGRDRVEARCRQLGSHLRQRLCEISSLRLLAPTQDELSSGMVSFALTKGSNQQVYERLHKEHDIVVKVVPKPEYNALRFSTHIFNREEDLDRTAGIIGAMLARS